MAKILYFARLREQLGLASEDVRLPENVRSVSALIAILRARGGRWAEALADESRVHVAVNCSMAGMCNAVQDDDEIALFPPVTGG